jgi:hypothetical protein
MGKVIDLTGQVFGRLTVLKQAEHGGNRVRWVCLCECGRCVTVRADVLKLGTSNSCGCLRRSLATTHGRHLSAEYNSWRGILQRCCNESCDCYDNYGGRGISLCDSWWSFETFYKDMGPKPSPEHSLDRIDNDGPYCKENCRWGTSEQQSNNRRKTVLVSYNGELTALAVVARLHQLPPRVLYGRVVDCGWSLDKALAVPYKPRK